MNNPTLLTLAEGLSKIPHFIANRTTIIVPKLPSRNDKCPCGSGKKFKKCCIKKYKFGDKK